MTWTRVCVRRRHGPMTSTMGEDSDGQLDIPRRIRREGQSSPITLYSDIDSEEFYRRLATRSPTGEEVGAEISNAHWAGWE